MFRRVCWVGMSGGAVLVALYAIGALALPALRSGIVRDRMGTAPFAVAMHLLGGAIAIGLGPLQLSDWIRHRHVAIHRWCGRAYVLAVVCGGAAALVLAPLSQGGLPAHVGFGLLAVVWLVATLAGYRSIRAGRQAVHRVWMLRSYGLTLAGLTLRLYLPLSQILNLPYDAAYPAIAWLCWVPNVIVVEWLILADGRSGPATMSAA